MKKITQYALFFAYVLCANNIYAYDIGQFTIRGFALATASYATNQCPRCQLEQDEDRQRVWADAIDGDKKFTPQSATVSIVQPYLEFRPYHVGSGFRVSALLSQRWRDGKIDIPGVIYEQNITLSHEYYGSIQYGAYPTRGWGIADYPYGTFLGVADPWGASGAGYGLVSNAIRARSAPFFVLQGELVVELTYDPGDNRYDQNQRFMEYYVQFVRGHLVVDAIHQHAKNGNPSSWTHGPFLGLTDDPKYDTEFNSDKKIPENEQKIWLLMSRYTFFRKYELMAGVRENYWSGTSAVIVGYNDDNDALWNNMFNVHWDGTFNGEANPGYPARSHDFLLGGRYIYNADYIVTAALVHLGKAKTDNPMQRGQSNTATFSNIGISYTGLYPGLQISSGISRIDYAKKGLAPLSMPSHSAFSGVDSRVKTSGVGIGITATYNF